jgi:hypothetical protein
MFSTYAGHLTKVHHYHYIIIIIIIIIIITPSSLCAWVPSRCSYYHNSRTDRQVYRSISLQAPASLFADIIWSA